MIGKNNVKNSKKRTVKKTQKYPQHLVLKGFLSFFILHELCKHKMTGDELAQAIGKRKGSVLAPGTIYPALKRLRKQKLVIYRKYGRDKVYKLTDEGEKELEGLYSLLGPMFSGLSARIRS